MEARFDCSKTNAITNIWAFHSTFWNLIDFFGKLTTLFVFYVKFLLWLQQNYWQLLKIMSNYESFWDCCIRNPSLKDIGVKMNEWIFTRKTLILKTETIAWREMVIIVEIVQRSGLILVKTWRNWLDWFSHISFIVWYVSMALYVSDHVVV